jgi:protein phosphatase
MGTTATVAALLGPRLFVAQVGDSRAYLVRGSGMAQLTRDQTLLNYLREIGVAVSAGPEMDSRKNILTQAVGSSAKVDVKITSSHIEQGDRLLLCSDGLYNMVDDDAILATLSRTGPLAHKCQSLIAQANSAGGLDNVTVVLAEFSGPGLPPALPSTPIECKELAEADFERQT